MKQLIPLLVLSFFLACTREEILPLKEIPGRLVMQAENNNAWLYTPSSGQQTSFDHGTPLRWAHNGAMIAVYSNPNYRILLANSPEEIFRFRKPEMSALCWSPDDNTLAYTAKNQIVFFHRLSNTFDTISLPDPYIYDCGIDWSADGNSLVLAARNTNPYEASILCTVRCDGSHFKILLTGGFNSFRNPRFAPNGEDIAFENTYSIQLIRPDGNDVRKFEPSATSPCWSANSEVLMYNQLRIKTLMSSVSTIMAREIGGDQRERTIYEDRSLIDWAPGE